jgi:hypothetical protein
MNRTDPHFASSPETEAVRLLATVTRQFLTDRANRRDLSEAVALWQEAVAIAEQDRHRDAYDAERLAAEYDGAHTLVG